VIIGESLREREQTLHLEPGPVLSMAARWTF
jgi:hypothetical protein